MTAPPPSGPVLPPPGLDMHITMLILPPLERYASTVQHGLRSRSWETGHDGMSFMVHKVEWVDEGASRGEQRGGEARRKRMARYLEEISGNTGKAVTAKRAKVA